MSENNMKHRSSVYDSMVKSPNRAMLRATGMTDDSFEKPIVGVISMHTVNICPYLDFGGVYSGTDQ